MSTRSRVANLFVVVAVMVGLGRLPAQAPGNSPLQFAPDHVSLSVANLEPEIAWYERVMGFKVVQRAKFGPDVDYVQMAIPGFRIDLLANKGSVRHRVLAAELEQGWKHIAFTTPDIGAVNNELLAKKTDVTPTKNNDGSVFRLIVHDPEGNEIELQPSAPPQAAGRAPADNPLQLTPGHATISAANLDKEVDWYQRVLGFTSGERTKIGDTAEVAHLSIPGYRIDVSWNKGSVRHVVLKRDLEQGWVHIVFRTSDIDAIYNRLTAEKADMTVNRGKDSKITEIFVNDPEGNELEFQPG